jgi:hypothetical protein
VRFGDILDLPIVLLSHHAPCNRRHLPHLQPSAIRCVRLCNGRRWDNLMSGSAPWTIDRNPSQVEAYRHHVL